MGRNHISGDTSTFSHSLDPQETFGLDRLAQPPNVNSLLTLRDLGVGDGLMVKKRVQRNIAANLAADLAGYSRLTGEDEEGTHRTLSAYLDAITTLIEGHGGRILHYAGDAVLAEFGNTVEAVRCAISCQCRAGFAAGCPLRYRCRQLR